MYCVSGQLLHLHDCVCEIVIHARAGRICHSLPVAKCPPQVPCWQTVSTSFFVLCNKAVRNFPDVTRGTEIITVRDVEHGELVKNRLHVDLRRSSGCR